MIDLTGQTLGQYRIETLLGSGGMGQVFRGTHRFLDRPAAIKVMQANLAADPAFRARFLREARAAAALKHPNIVEIYEFGEQEGYLYLVMELMTGGSLRTLLQRHAGHPLPLDLGLDLVCQAAEGLAAAHAQGIIHRDIKPDNLLLNRIRSSGPALAPARAAASEHYQLKISDFGLARLAEAGGMSTVAGPMGTLAYMSPEQCQSLPLDGRSDLYALGVVLYEVTTGVLPFQINTLTDAFNKHVHVPPRPPREVCSDLPPSVQQIILRCLSKQPEERYASAAELATVLQGVWHTLQTSAHTPTGETELQAPEEQLVPPTVSTLSGPSSVPRVRVVDRDGQTLHVVELHRQGLTLGRQADCDVLLPSQAISRRHAQILWDGSQVLVKDLGSSNGTFLADVRLLPQESQPWHPQQWLRLGPYWLRLEEAGPEETRLATGTGTGEPTAMVAATSGQRVSSATPVLGGSNRIGMAVTPGTLSLTPGQASPVQVSLTNLGSTVDWFTTMVEGVPPGWVQGAGEAVQLNPGMRQTVTLSVSVARSPSNQAGEYPVTLRARSREKPKEAGIVQAHWTVLPFTDDALELQPRKASGHGTAAYAVSLHNGGNTQAQYSLQGEDDERGLTYAFGHNPVTLAAGQETDVPLQVSTQRHWFGREQHQPFQVHARPAGTSNPLTASGEFVNRALIPTWVLPVVGAVLAAALLLGLLLPKIVNPGNGTGTTAPPLTITTPGTTPTSQQPTAGTQGTATAQANESATAQAQGNANATATAQAQGNANATATAQAQANANATATAQAQANATVKAHQDKYTNATGGTPVLDDPLSDNSKGYGWNVGSGYCQFTGGVLHAIRPTPGAINCDATGASSYSNFAFQVQMMIIKGDAGGIDFRTNSGGGYFFSIGQDGTYKVYSEENYSLQTVASGTSAAIQTGLGQTNLVTVIAQGNTFDFYANKQYITTVTDSTYSQGYVGVDAFDNTNPTEVAFNNAKVWAL